MAEKVRLHINLLDTQYRKLVALAASKQTPVSVQCRIAVDRYINSVSGDDEQRYVREASEALHA